MNKAHFEIIRPGIHSTLQDLGRSNQYHIGIPFSGSMDKRNYLIGNKLVGNKLKEASLEFAYQGPLIKLKLGKVTGVITGNVTFNILRKNSKIEKGSCYKTFELKDGDQLDIISTNKSVYGYFSIKNGFTGEYIWGSCSVNTKAKIGSNDGEKFGVNQKIYINKNESLSESNKIDYFNSKIEFIRVLKGTNFNFFSEKAKQIFFSKEFIVSKLTDRMGMRLEGQKIENIAEANIKSEGLIKGVIQVPPDGNPIIMLSDHGTIGGYPKIAIVISADYDRLTQLTPGSKINLNQSN
jgi:Allophanate hydrolase subunit 2